MSKIKLPKLSECIYNAESQLETISLLREKMEDVSNEFLPKSSVMMKLDEELDVLRYNDVAQSHQLFVKNMREIWAPDLIELFIKNNIRCSISMRRKSIISLLQKMNRQIASGKAVDSIHDLMGIEIVVYTTGISDSAESIAQAYQVMNLAMPYFLQAGHKQGLFLACDAGELKNSVPADLSAKEKRNLIQVDNPHFFIPESSGLKPEFRNIVKDYYYQPKKKTFYQGLQADLAYVDKKGKRSYFEIQVKTQVVRDDLDEEYLPNGEKNPAFHDFFRMTQTENSEKLLDGKIPQFDLSFEPEKCYHIPGFRKDYSKDRSGIVAPTIWSLCYSSHN